MEVTFKSIFVTSVCLPALNKHDYIQSKCSMKQSFFFCIYYTNNCKDYMRLSFCTYCIIIIFLVKAAKSELKLYKQFQKF